MSEISSLTSSSTSGNQRHKILRSAELLSLLLAPDLDDSLTPGALVGADNEAIFRLLPLILAAIHRLGMSATRRDRFVGLISVLRLRIASCRVLKLRFLLLIHNSVFAKHWDVRLVHRRDCYSSARLILEEKIRDTRCVSASDESFEMATQLRNSETVGGSKQVEGWAQNNHRVVAFAVRRVLHPEQGIKTRNMKWHMRVIKNAFFASELVDGIMERANFTNREEAVALGQKMLDMGIIHKVGHRQRSFADEKRRVYQCRLATLRDDEGHCKVVTADGNEIGCWEQLKKCELAKISQIEIQLAMDMIDLQSYGFWTESVYVKGVSKGYRYGFRTITHPLQCSSSSAKPQLDIPGSSVETSSADQLSLDQESLDGSAAEELNLSPAQQSMDDINRFQEKSAIVGSVVVKKVFSSIARPMIVDLQIPMENMDLTDEEAYISQKPGVLVKEGDNLMQDLGVEIMFQCFNHVWAHSSMFTGKENDVPFSYSYEVFPTSPTRGFMQAVTGLTSLKEYDWHVWRQKHGSDPARVNDMVRSTVGAYVATYVCGGRDRHFDNVLIKDDKYLLHIDFGFLMGTSPPIDGPRIAIAPQMEAVFRDLKVWDKFVELFVDAFIALRRVAPAIIRTSVIMFSKAGYDEHQIRAFLQGRFSLNVHEKEKKAAELVRRQLVHSSTDIKTRFKAFAHEHIDPAWYGLLEKGFPPAVAIMKIVDAKEQKAAKRLSSITKGNVSEHERIQL